MQNPIFARAIANAPLLLLVIITPFFFIGGSNLESSRLFNAAWNMGHIVFFCLLVLQLHKKYSLTTLRSALIISLIVFVIGGSIELIQLKIGREGNWEDLFNDLAGTWIGLVWVQPVSRWLWCARIAVLTLSAPIISNILLIAVLDIHAAREFPRLADFESPLDLYEFSRKLERSEEFHTHGKYGLKLTLTPEPYSGISIARSFADWSPYKQFSVDLYNPDVDPLDIVIRVNDIAHDVGGWNYNDRFNQSFRLQQGWNHLSIPVITIQQAPAHRLMDLSRVSLIVIFIASIPDVRVIYIDNLRLEE